jgi:hypothetical protein
MPSNLPRRRVAWLSFLRTRGPNSNPPWGGKGLGMKETPPPGLSYESTYLDGLHFVGILSRMYIKYTCL